MCGNSKEWKITDMMVLLYENKLLQFCVMVKTL